jgi:hypothetical protein
MAIATKAASKGAAPKKFYFSIKEGEKTTKYQLKGRKYIFKGVSHSQEGASKNAELCAALVAANAPAIEIV